MSRGLGRVDAKEEKGGYSAVIPLPNRNSGALDVIDLREYNEDGFGDPFSSVAVCELRVAKARPIYTYIYIYICIYVYAHIYIYIYIYIMLRFIALKGRSGGPSRSGRPQDNGRQ